MVSKRLDQLTTTGTVERLSTPAVVVDGAVVPPIEDVVRDGMPVPVGMVEADVLVCDALVDPWPVEVPVAVVPVVELPFVEGPVVEVPVAEVAVVDVPVAVVPVWETPVEEVTPMVDWPPVVVPLVELDTWTKVW